MKNFRLYIFCLMLPALIFNAACYQPIANTSGTSGDKSERDAKNENTATENMENNSEVANSGANDSSKEDTMNKSDSKNNISAEGFRGNLSQNLSRHNLSVSDIYDESNAVENRIFNEYGAVFLTKAMPPNEVMFTSEQEVSAFQTKAGVEKANIGGTNIELQPTALKALQEAIADAKSQGLKITPRDGAEAARRSYQKTLSLWNDRFFKACDHWKAKGRLTSEKISQLKALPIKQQVGEVLELEKQGIYFNTFFNNSILYSVAAPGTSQHLSMLAFDVTEFENKKVREVLAKHGWFRTVQNDEPHFTYLGYQESELSKLGLKMVTKKDGEFWIPNI